MTNAHAPQYLPIDSIANARVGIDYPHSRIHSGNHFICSYSKSLSAGSVLAVAITTPTSGTGYIHYTATLEANLSGTWVISESASVSGGSALTVFNNDRSSAATSGTTIVGTPTVTTYGTSLETHIVGTNSVTSPAGGLSIQRGEYILATATTYVVYFTANATSTYSSITSSFYLD